MRRGRFKRSPSSNPEAKMAFRKNPRARGKGRKAARLSRNFSLVINTIERRWAKEDFLGSNEGHRYLRQEKKREA